MEVANLKEMFVAQAKLDQTIAENHNSPMPLDASNTGAINQVKLKK